GAFGLVIGQAPVTAFDGDEQPAQPGFYRLGPACFAFLPGCEFRPALALPAADQEVELLHRLLLGGRRPRLLTARTGCDHKGQKGTDTPTQGSLHAEPPRGVTRAVYTAPVLARSSHLGTRETHRQRARIRVSTAIRRARTIKYTPLLERFANGLLP